MMGAVTDAASVPVIYVGGDDRTAELLICTYGEISWRMGARPERFAPHAFTSHLAGKQGDRVKIVNSHAPDERAVARVTKWHLGGDQLRARIRYFGDSRGWDAWTRARDGEITAASPQWRTLAEHIAGDGVREILTAQLLHVAIFGPELQPAYDSPRLLEVRSPIVDETERLLAIKYPPDLAKCPDPWEREAVHKKLLALCSS